MSKHAKFFTLDLGNRIDTVSNDRLKAANSLDNVTDDDCLDSTFNGIAAEQTAPVFCHRLGRIIRTPFRFNDYVPLKS